MRCPKCKHSEDRVLDSRQNQSGSSIRRRRECLNCKNRFTSYEQIEDQIIKVIKRDKSREEFDLEKIKLGVERSLKKRPISVTSQEELLESINDQIISLTSTRRELDTETIGNLVLEHLQNFDSVAYIRFASVYKKFEDVQEFIAEIDRL